MIQAQHCSFLWIFNFLLLHTLIQLPTASLFCGPLQYEEKCRIRLCCCIWVKNIGGIFAYLSLRHHCPWPGWGPSSEPYALEDSLCPDFRHAHPKAKVYRPKLAYVETLPPLIDQDLGTWDLGISHPDITGSVSKARLELFTMVPPASRWCWLSAPPRPEEWLRGCWVQGLWIQLWSAARIVYTPVMRSLLAWEIASSGEGKRSGQGPGPALPTMLHFNTEFREVWES